MASLAWGTLATPHAKPFTGRTRTRFNLYCKKQASSPVTGRFDHLFGTVKKDWEFLKKGVDKGLNWANETLQIPKVVKTVDHVVWLRHLEDPNLTTTTFVTPSWPHPHYPALTGVDLLLADLEALATYVNYFSSMSRLWSRPLPEVYDVEEISNYFNCRPHIIGLRVLEVFFAFSSAVIKIRSSRIGEKYQFGTGDGNREDASLYDFGKVLKDSMLSLGPTFIKVGQSLSTRPDITGPEISKALSELHDRIPPFPREVAMKIIEEELGSPVTSFFSYISPEPIAAASFGQVYRGLTCDGSDVAIKVQRPNLHHVVARDIYILRLGLGLLRKIARRKYDIRLYADELGKGLMGELDYRLEAENAVRFLDAHSSFSFIHVPKVSTHLTRKRVLTMDWVVGENPNDLLMVSTGDADDRSAYSEKQKAEAKRRLLDLVSKGVEASLVQLLETGFLHADPHPGNLRYTTSGQIGFLDFGLMCQMERKHQMAMLGSIIHIVNGDWGSLVQALSEMDVVMPGTNIRLVTRELENALGEVEFNDGIPDVKFSKVLGKIWSVAHKYHFRMPPYYTLLLRSLASLEGLAIAADENFKTFEAAYPYVVRKLLTDNSEASRRILHSVILNRRRELQWKRLTVFLRFSAGRKCLPKVMESSNSGTLLSSSGAGETFDATTFVLTLLSSKDGSVLRRLLITADGSSLVRALLSKEAAPVRQQLCRSIADVLNQWIAAVTGNLFAITASLQPLEMSCNYQLILRDPRLKVILRKILSDARQDWGLMLRFCLTSFAMLVTASAMACRRVISSLSQTYMGRMSLTPTRVVANT